MTENKKITLDLLGDLWRTSVRLNGILWRDRKYLLIGLAVFTILTAAMPLAGSGFRGLVINELTARFGQGANFHLWLLIGAMLAVTALRPISRIMQMSFDRRFFIYMEERFRLDHMMKCGELDIAHHENPELNDLISKTKEQGTWRIQNFGDRQFFLAENIVEALIAAAILVFADWRIFLLILAGTLPGLVAEVRFGRDTWGVFDGMSEDRRKFWNIAKHFDAVNYVSELKLFQNVGYFFAKAQEFFHAYQENQGALEKKKLRIRILTSIISQGVLGFAVVWFILRVTNGLMQIGTLVFFMSAIGELQSALSGLFDNLARQYEDGLFSIEYFKLLDMETTVPVSAKAAPLRKRRTPDIVFDHVSFAYPGSARNILQDFSCSIRAGEKIALVGSNGAGKTTFVKLLCRFYDPTGGRILLDGQDLREIDLSSWYEQLAVLSQEFANYRFLAKESIAIGRTSVPLKLSRVRGAADASESRDFIEKWADGYDQVLGKMFRGGVEPSGGQWQKLALARTFYRDARVLILDEPTAALDPDAEEAVFDRLEALPDDRTVVLISHRFSTVRRADRIFVIENGTLSEEGVHESLLALDGTYARMFQKQARGYV